MNVQQLIDELQKIEDKTKAIKNTNGVVMNELDEVNGWVYITN